jgi:hypothetical protein
MIMVMIMRVLLDVLIGSVRKTSRRDLGFTSLYRFFYKTLAAEKINLELLGEPVVIFASPFCSAIRNVAKKLSKLLYKLSLNFWSAIYAT